MQSYVRTVMGDQVTTATTPTNSGTNSVTSVARRYTNLSVTNGNVQGNKVEPNPISFTKLFVEAGPYYSYRRQKATDSGYGTNQVSGWYMPSYYDSDPNSGRPDYSVVNDRVLEKIFDQLRGNNNIIVDWAERASTLRMLRDTLRFRKVAAEFFVNVVKHRSYRRIPKGPTQGQKRLDYVTSKWLEYRYGWQPLIYSVYDAADNLDRDLREKFFRIDAISGIRKGPYTSTTGNGTFGAPKVRIVDIGSDRCEMKLFFKSDAGPKISDWTSLNPFGIAWELMPLSFVADWFVNVSQQLSLWENFFLYQKNFIKGYRTTSSMWIRATEMNGSTGPNATYWPNGSIASYDYGVVSGGCIQKSTRKNRTVLTTLPMPSGRLRVNVKLNWKRQLDAVALIHVLFAKNAR